MFSCAPACAALSEGLEKADGKAPPKLKPDAVVVALLAALNPPKVGALAEAKVDAPVAGVAAGVVVAAGAAGFPNVNPLVPNPAAAVAPTVGNAETAGAGVGVLFSPPGAEAVAAPCCPNVPKVNGACVVVVVPVAPLLEAALFPN